MLENYYDEILLYINQHAGCGAVTIGLNATLSTAIINSTIDELYNNGYIRYVKGHIWLTDKGYAYLEVKNLITLKKKPDLIKNPTQNKIPAKLKSVWQAIKRISLFEWAAMITIMSFFVYLWIIFFR